MIDLGKPGCRRGRRWRYIFFVVGVVVGVAGLLLCRHGGWTPKEPLHPTCPLSALPPEQTCEGTPSNTTPAVPSSAGPAEPLDVPHNGLSVESLDVPHNGLGTTTLAEPPNQKLLLELKAHALTKSLFSDDPAVWRPLLSNAYAPDLVEYVVSCALDPGEYVGIPAQWAELAPLRHRFTCGLPGQLGLCSQSYTTWASHQSPTPPIETTWSAEAATQACLERVSACVLARVNAVEARVPISMRGGGTNLLAKVPVQTQFRENHGTPIQSFQRCDQMCLRGDRVRRNCDWEPRYVGQCMRGPGDGPRKVRLEVEPTVAVRVRICEGLYGCDDTAPGLGAGAATAPVFAHGRLVEFPTPYGGQMIYQGTTENGNTIEFDCPDDGPRVPGSGGELIRTGYYSVMLGALEPTAAVPASADVTLAPPAGEPLAAHDTYPAPEKQVFTYREGGFYGTIFSSSPPLLPPPPPPNEKFACASEIWSYGVATAEDRLCAGPLGSVLPEGCFGHYPPGQCDAPSDPGSCDAAASEPKVYDACRGGPSHWQHPYTTYLNHPCDLFATDEACTRYLKDRKEAAVRRMPPLPKDYRGDPRLPPLDRR